MTFNMGDVCIGQNARRDPTRNGMECTVINGLKWHDFLDPVTHLPTGHGGITYLVEWPDGHRCCAWPDQLRKKQLPICREELGEWALCPWWPTEIIKS